MYDIIIIGAGPAGLAAAVYGQRAEKKTLLIDEKGYGGQIINTPEVENYPAIQKISGFEFANNLYQQASNLGAELTFEKAIGIENKGDVKIVKTEGGAYETKTVIIATGAKNRPLGLDREEEMIGRGVAYCATCDGAFYRGKTVAVIGGGNTALEDAEVLSSLADKVYLIHRRDAFRGEEANVKRIHDKENIEILLNKIPTALLGEEKISGLEIEDKLTEEKTTLILDGVFVAIGQMPDNEAFAQQVHLDEKGYVTAGEDCLTKTGGIFVAGDCRTKKVRQLATAVSDGAVAALAAVEYINQEHI
ncbi:MAG: FAD-dependent oxidoreductase [Firmicutes bacterium]|nr:FAD-dependent oxidoreductase [Bacillota bacterium]